MVVILKEGYFKELEVPLSAYIRCRMAHRNGSALFRVDIVCRSAFRIVHKFVSTCRAPLGDDQLAAELRDDVQRKGNPYGNFFL